jgi:branched-subunit amino acid aminotransferase/4-amino-4-deoxychorismate lyase
MTLLAVAVSGRGIVDPDEPVLHADDEALLRGRAVFETLRVYDGRPFRLEQHLERLARSAQRIGLAPVDEALLRGLADDALRAAGDADVALRFLWTPGREGTGEPTGIALVSTLPRSQAEELERGLRLVTVRTAVAPLLAGVKSTSYAANIAARDEAIRHGADDAVLLAADGTVLEGPTANLWLREGATLVTPTLELPILAGVTRSVVLELAEGHGYAVEETTFPVKRLVEADEIFMSSTVREIAGCVELDGKPIGDGRPGEAAKALQQALRVVAREG